MIHDIFTPGNQLSMYSAFDSDRTCFAPPKSDPGHELRRQSPESDRETAAEESFQSVQPPGDCRRRRWLAKYVRSGSPWVERRVDKDKYDSWDGNAIMPPGKFIHASVFRYVRHRARTLEIITIFVVS
jgi:hypothetical protein